MTAQQIALEMRKSCFRKQRHFLAWLRQYPGRAPWKPTHPEDPASNATSRASMSRMLDRLERRGLLRRLGNVRTRQLELTPVGRQVAELLKQ